MIHVPLTTVDFLAAVKELGKTIAGSKMLGCENVQQGEVIAYECLTRGRSPLYFAQRFHVMNGRLNDRAEFMLAIFRSQGGTCVWQTNVDDTQKQIAVWSYRENQNVTIGFTLAEAEKAKLVKGGSGWEKNPAEMLQARCITRAVRRLAPELLKGFYAAEEVDPHYMAEPFVAESQIIDAVVPAVAITAAIEAEPVAATKVEESSPVEAEPAPTAKTRKSKATPPAATDNGNDPCDEQQRNRITDLFARLAIPPDTQSIILAKRGASAMRVLTRSQADEIIANLQKKLGQEVAETTGTTDVGTTPGEAISSDGPCLQTQADSIRAVLDSAQDQELYQAVKAHLHELGKGKLVELTYDQARHLLDLVNNRESELFIAKSLPSGANTKSLSSKETTTGN